MKGMIKQLQSLYDYSQSLDFMPPRGDGAKDAVAVEIHKESERTFNLMKKQLEGKHPEKFVETSFLLLELVERMLLDKIGGDYTPEEMIERSDI
jgi:hypothetical protein